MSRSRRWLLAPMVAVVAIASCNDQPTTPGLVQEVVVEHGPVRALVERTSGLAGRESSVVIRIESRDVSIGAYQGEFRFDPRVLELVDVTTPTDGYRVINSEGARDGRVRFAGFAVGGFEGDIAATLTFRARSMGSGDGSMSLSIDVVSNTRGEVVGPPRPKPSVPDAPALEASR